MRPQNTSSALTGIGLTLLACLAFSVLDAGSKYMGAALPLLMALWLRYVLQTMATIGYGLATAGASIFQTRHWRFQCTRAVLFCMSNAFAMLSLRYLPLAEFTAIAAMTPLAMTLVAALWLHQPVSPLRWALVTLGFAGTLIIVRPGSGAFTAQALLWPLLQMLTNTAYQIVSSEMAGKERPVTTQIYTSLVALALTSACLPWVWKPVMNDGLMLGALAMGLGSAIGHLCVLKAYEYAHPATIAPFFYSQILCATAAGWLMYRHIPDHWAMTGMLIIITSGALSAWLSVRESR